MEIWQKIGVIIAILTFLRLVFKDIMEYIEKRNDKKAEYQKQLEQAVNEKSAYPPRKDKHSKQ